MTNVHLVLCCVAVVGLLACSSEDGGETPAPAQGGSGGSAQGGSAGSAVGGSAGSAVGGSAGAAVGGSAGAAVGGNAGAAQGGNAGAAGAASLKVTCTTSDYSCTCVANSSAEPSGTCKPEDVGGGICCAGSGYPNTDITTCQCIHWGCEKSTAASCKCGTGPVSSYPETSCSAEHNVCCKGNLGFCMCWKGGDCPSGDTKVPNCESAKAESCLTGQSLIDTCTL